MYDMTVPESVLTQAANDWWRSLSTNQQKYYKSRHFPFWQQLPHIRMIHVMWEKEDKPDPQESKRLTMEAINDNRRFIICEYDDNADTDLETTDDPIYVRQRLEELSKSKSVRVWDKARQEYFYV